MVDMILWISALLSFGLLFRYIKQVNDRVSDTQKQVYELIKVIEEINKSALSEQGYFVRRNGFMWDICKDGKVIDSKPLASSAFKAMQRLAEQDKDAEIKE